MTTTRLLNDKAIRYFLTVFLLHYTVELRWLEPLWDHENLFETAVVTISATPGGTMEIIVGYLFGVLYFKCMLCVLIRIAS